MIPPTKCRRTTILSVKLTLKATLVSSFCLVTPKLWEYDILKRKYYRERTGCRTMMN